MSRGEDSRRFSENEIGQKCGGTHVNREGVWIWKDETRETSEVDGNSVAWHICSQRAYLWWLRFSPIVYTDNYVWLELMHPALFRSVHRRWPPLKEDIGPRARKQVLKRPHQAEGAWPRFVNLRTHRGSSAFHSAIGSERPERSRETCASLFRGAVYRGGGGGRWSMI